MTPDQKLAEITALCRRYAHPGSNPGAHRLAVDVIWIAEGKPERGEDRTAICPGDRARGDERRR